MSPWASPHSCINGIDPFTKKLLAMAKKLSDRKLQRTLMTFFEPENSGPALLSPGPWWSRFYFTFFSP